MSAPPRLLDPLVPVSLITGFLGSGKTTLLNTLLRDPAAGRMAVVVNEFGEVGLDHDLIERAEDETVLLEGGCLCCTVRGQLTDTLRRLFIRRERNEIPRFERLVIETTGLADPAPILQALMIDPVIASQYTLDGVVTTIDGVNGAATLDRQAEAVKQVGVADRIVLTKSDLATAEAVGALEARLRALNPAVPILMTGRDPIGPDRIFGCGAYDPANKTPDVQGWLKAEAYDHAHHRHDHHDHDRNRHDDRIRAFCITYDKPVTFDALAAWLETLLLVRGPDLLRIKGLIHLEGEAGPVVLHGVQEVFHPLVHLERWPSADRRSRIVFVTRDLEPSRLEQSLREFNEGPERRMPVDAS